MQDIMSPVLTKRIHSFMVRKDREFPELALRRKWYDYELSPRPRVGKTRKYAHQ
jgi:hypothetical protein